VDPSFVDGQMEVGGNEGIKNEDGALPFLIDTTTSFLQVIPPKE